MSATELSSTPPAAAAPRKRTKRSWTRIETKIDPGTFTFWLTPEGIHRRLKGSPQVRSKDWAAVNAFLNDSPIEFELNNRHYTARMVSEGLRLERGAESKLITPAEIVEWMDGQKVFLL